MNPGSVRCPTCRSRLPSGTPLDCCPFCATDEPDPQRRVIGECELLEELGRGGMGVVWRARQLGLDREVAVNSQRWRELETKYLKDV